MKKTVKKALCLCLGLLMLVLSLPVGGVSATTANAAEVIVDGSSLGFFTSFSEAWKKAIELAPTKDGESDSEVTLKLTVDLVAADGSFGEGTGFDGGAVLLPTGKCLTLDMDGHSIDRGLTSAVNKGYVIAVGEKAELEIIGSSESYTGSKITGGYNSAAGGGILVKADAKLKLRSLCVSGNTANIGGGIYLEGKSSKLSMETVTVSENKATAMLSGGGGIAVGGEGAVIVGSGANVEKNSANYGGGIYFDAPSVSVSSVIVAENEAAVDGGGVYFAKSGCSLSGASGSVENNSAEGKGGNIYVYKEGCSLSDMSVIGGKAGDTAGGIYVEKDCTFSISGEMVIKDNGGANLYLEGADLSVGSMSDGSEVYITLKDGAEAYLDKSFVSGIADTKPEYFYSDMAGYYVTRQSDPAKENYRYLYLAEGERPYTPAVEHKDTDTVADYGTYEGESGSYDLYKGLFEYASVLDSENNYASVFYYSDGYFDADPRDYNSHLATMSLNLAMSAFAKNSTTEDKYLNQFAHVKKLMSDIGCSDEDIYVNEDYIKQPALFGEDADRLSTIGVAIGKKNITVGGEEYVLVPVAVRGAGYEIEWGSNVTLGAEGEAQGFADAATQTVKMVEDYIKEYGLEAKLNEGKVKFWLAGYSRASATANIAAKRLIDKYGEKNDIFAYCFEVPQGASDSERLKLPHTDDGGYYSIHNLINKADFVTLVGPSEMGLTRYGVDHYVPGDPELLTQPSIMTTTQNGGQTTVYADNSFDGYKVSYDESSPYYNQRMKMLTQLQSVNPHIQFEDYFHEATINYVGYVTGFKDLIGEVGNNNVTPDEFLDEFFALFQQWGLSSEAESDYRKYYASHRPWVIEWGEDKPEDLGYFDTDMSVQEAVGVAIGLIFGKSAEESDAIMEALMNSALGISAVSLEDISLLEVYMDYVGKWQNKTNAEKVEMGNRLIDAILTEPYPGAGTVLDYLTEEEGENLKKALPVILDLALTVLGEDYVYKKSGDTQVMLGTFAYNMNTLIMAHYPEINLAWLRSYDSFYDSETSSHVIVGEKPASPAGSCVGGNLILSAEKGSAVYYSLDDGATWQVYLRPTAVTSATGKVKAFTMAYGLRSEEATFEMIVDSQSTTGGESSSQPNVTPEGSGDYTLYLIGGGAAVVIIAAVAVIMIIKKKKSK